MPRCSRRHSARLLPRCCLNFPSDEVFPPFTQCHAEWRVPFEKSASLQTRFHPSAPRDLVGRRRCNPQRSCVEGTASEEEGGREAVPRRSGSGCQQDAASCLCGIERQQTLLLSTLGAWHRCVTSAGRWSVAFPLIQPPWSMLSVRSGCHLRTAQAHVQPQAAAARILLRAGAASLNAKSGRDKPTCAFHAPCAFGGIPHLKKSSTDSDAATGGLQSSPWRCGLSAAEALASSLRLEDANSSPRSGGDDRRSRTAVKHKKPRWKDL